MSKINLKERIKTEWDEDFTREITYCDYCEGEDTEENVGEIQHEEHCTYGALKNLQDAMKTTLILLRHYQYVHPVEFSLLNISDSIKTLVQALEDNFEEGDSEK